MADNTLGKLLAKSKSIRRSRKGSVGANSSTSVGSDDTASIPPGLSSLSRLAHRVHSPSRSRSRSQSLSQPAAPSEPHDLFKNTVWTDSDNTQTTTIEISGGGKEDAESTSLISYDSEEADL